MDISYLGFYLILQVMWFGYFGISGVIFMDYILIDEVIFFLNLVDQYLENFVYMLNIFFIGDYM